MKNLLAFLIPVGLTCIVILFAAFGGDDLRNGSGAPPGYTNSPGDGQNCSHCMGGSAVAVTGWITSDIPGTGYIPGTTYSITVTGTGTGNKGFEVSPQDETGNLIGTLIAGAGNKLVGTGKYVTHNQASSADPKTWTFQWTAPASGAGDVTFYGSIAIDKLNTKTTTMTVSQSTVGIAGDQASLFKIFPVPAYERISVTFSLGTPSNVCLDLFSTSGKSVSSLMQESCPSGIITRNFILNQPAGIYFLRLNTGDQDQIRKIILQ